MSQDASNADDAASTANAVERPLSLAAVVGAVRQLTILGAAPTSDRPGRSLLWYPLVGLVLGLVWLAVDLAAAPFVGALGANVARLRLGAWVLSAAGSRLVAGDR